MFDYLLHPVDQSPIVVGRYLPQRLLPPHDADDDAKQAVTDMLHGALRRIGSPRQRRYCGAAQEQEPEDHELVEEATTTTVIWVGQRASVDRFGLLSIEERA